MAEIRRGFGGDGYSERLPWLEPVDEEPEPGEGGYGGLILAALAVVAAIAIIVGGVLWLRHAKAREADLGTIIRAPIGPYKIKPADAGGMPIASGGMVVERTGIGGDINGQLDPDAVPEQPVAGPGSAEGTQPPITTAPIPAPLQPTTQPVVPTATKLITAKPLPTPSIAAAAPVAKPKPAASGAAGSIQLGAFSTEAKAQAAWKALAKRFDYLAVLTEAVVPVSTGDTTLYRLRASGAGAAKVCGQLKLAGESCSIL